MRRAFFNAAGSREDGYEVLRPIGSGSFGQVFLVLHRREKRQYVMKEITSLATMEEKQREATELEVKLLSAMRHPNIVDTYELGEFEDILTKANIVFIVLFGSLSTVVVFDCYLSCKK